MNGEYFHWPLEVDISHDTIEAVADALVHWVNEDMHRTEAIGDEMSNVVNHIYAWLQKHPPKDPLLA
jgi:hypothetical protein